jgi:hypothetical protein
VKRQGKGIRRDGIEGGKGSMDRLSYPSRRAKRRCK